MSSITKPIILDETGQAINEALQELNRLIAHQNASIDLLASDKRADLVTNIADVALLAKNGELLSVMNYGDEIHPEWVYGETHYNPEMNFCHVSDAELEDGEVIHGAFFEWDKGIPFGVTFDAAEAIYYFDGTEGSGDKYISIGSAWGTGWSTSKSIQITLSSAPDAGDQLYIDCNMSNKTDPTNGRNWYVYAKGSTTAKQSGTTSNGTSGTCLGSTSTVNERGTNGRVNSLVRVVQGYARWAQSAMRQWLNSDGEVGTWWQPQNDWDRPPAELSILNGFLYNYDPSVTKYFKTIKVTTIASDYDDNEADVTYDKVFLSSLEQMYAEPIAQGEGEYWEYYKRLLGRTTPAPVGQTFPRLIKYDIGAPTTAIYCYRRSTSLTNPQAVIRVGNNGALSATGAIGSSRCAPAMFIST